MTVPPGFLGTEADLLMDLLVVVVPAILAVMAIAWWKVRGKAYEVHRNIMVTLTCVLAVAVTALEVHIATSGGLAAILGGELQPALHRMLQVHLAFAFTAAFTWIGLVAVSLVKFPKPLRPGTFSARHRLFGRIGMVSMIGTATTSVAVYALAFLF
jgi:uncharacterized membrane protein YozB (DUF420 family)